MQESAKTLVEDLRPVFMNTRRNLGRDSEGAERVTKQAVVSLEDYDCVVNDLQNELVNCAQAMEIVLSIADPVDQFRLQMPDQLAQANELVSALVAQRDAVKKKYADMLAFFKVAGMKSSDFCLLWDDFFIPEMLITRRPDKIKKVYLIPTFCQRGPIAFDDLLVLWNFKEPDLKPKAKKVQAKSARRVSRMVPQADANKAQEIALPATPAK